MTLLPKNSRRLRLGEIAERIDYGHTASASTESIGPKFLRITDIQNDEVNWNNVPYCACSDEEAERYSLAPGDIVFARTGATTGKSYLLIAPPTGAIFASYLIRVRPGSTVDASYLVRFFQTPDYWRQITKSSTGTDQPGVNATKLKHLEIPLPPLAEQRRIAAILGKADTILRKHENGARIARDLLNSLAQRAFRGDV